MKYSIRENPDHTYTLLRHDEPVTNPLRAGRPSNAELEFWLRIEQLEDTIRQAIMYSGNRVPEWGSRAEKCFDILEKGLERP